MGVLNNRNQSFQFVFAEWERLSRDESREQCEKDTVPDNGSGVDIGLIIEIVAEEMHKAKTSFA
ncbi:hypothetical protein CHS0354_019765 [Potamilus streckersoni]|uniref:Uncharacterized protein n=1 Tax=Potamilus streckersoni TaxID=2493646 RepID=A0AAE0S9M5_9BIVA|nr:hypothetical protein CHS0354_019765 [Potamilus streckersoni]